MTIFVGPSLLIKYIYFYCLRVFFLYDCFSVEHLHNAVLTEKAKVASYAHKLEELRQLLGDKTKAIDSLRRQLEGGSGGGECAAAGGGSHYRSSAGRTSAGATGGVGLGASRREYSSSDFKAIEFLRSSGHFIGTATAHTKLKN